MSSPRFSRRLSARSLALSLVAAPLALIPMATPAQAAPIVDIQILATNDFHGRIANDPQSSAAGAATLAGAVKQLRTTNPNTVFAAAGDLIGASTFESFIQKDKPTIDALNEAGLDVSSAGNHEFDQGYNDLVNRVMAPFNATTNPQGGAEWDYIAANLRKKADNTHALAPTYTETFSGVQVGFVGAVTEHLPELVNPDGISTINVTDIVTEVNASAAALKTAGADVIVMLVHEGAPSTDCATMDDAPTSDFGSIVTGASPDIDAIVSGHTHLAYNCSFVVPAWSTRPVKERPVVSAGQYGANLNQLNFKVDAANGQVTAVTANLLALKSANGGPANYPSDQPTAAIVADAVTEADVLGAEPLGKLAGAQNRAKLADGTTENRGGESTAGNLVAEVQQWATEAPTFGSSQIAFMNPGGLRADITGTGDAGAPYPRDLTFRQAANVQPFANTLVNLKLKGSVIKEVLEQQWQPEGAARPFLKLGASEGFRYTYDPNAAQGSRISGMWLNSAPINPDTDYSVTVNSFLAAGGDAFTAFTKGTGARDTGKIDLQSMVDYLADKAATTPLPVDFSQRAVGVDFPADAPETYKAGTQAKFNVSSLMMTGPGDLTDTMVKVNLGSAELGSFPVTNTAQAALPGFDEAGTASVDVKIPAGTPTGPATLLLTGDKTGTATVVPIQVEGLPAPAITATVNPGRVQVATGKTTVSIDVAEDPEGTVAVFANGKLLGAKELVEGHADIQVGPLPTAGTQALVVGYTGDGVNFGRSSTTVNVKVDAQRPKMKLKAPKKVRVGKKAKITAILTAVNQNVVGPVEFFPLGQKKAVRKLVNGRATFAVKFRKTGRISVIVKYLGQGNNKPVSKLVRVRVTR